MPGGDIDLVVGLRAVTIAVVAVVWFAVVLVLRPARLRPAAAQAAGHRGVAPLDERLDREPLPEGELPL